MSCPAEEENLARVVVDGVMLSELEVKALQLSLTAWANVIRASAPVETDAVTQAALLTHIKSVLRLVRLER